MLRYMKAILFTLTIGIALTVTNFAQTSNQVLVYEHTNYGGAYMSFNGIREEADLRSYNTGALGSPNWNDRISSLKVGSELKLIVFRDINFKGTSWTVTGPATIKTLVSNGWNDKISSFRIVPK